jgi:polyhydroxyalkanoate synthase
MTKDKTHNLEDLLNPMKMTGNLILAKTASDSAMAVKRIRKAKDVLLGQLNTEIAPTPYDIVYEEDRVKLKHYKPVRDIVFETPLFVTYAMVNRETMLDLQHGRSVVQRFLDAGIDLYVIDWWYPTRKDRYLTIDDHVNGYMDNMIDFVLERTGRKNLNLMGICMGGTYSIMYAALHPEKIKNLVLTVTPVNFDTDQGLLNVWARSIDADAMVGAYGNIPGDILNLAFLLLNPPRLMVDKYVGFLENIDDRDFVENFMRMERWIFDSPDLPGETFRQFIKDLFQKNLLIKNKMELNGKRIDLKMVTMPVLNIYAKYDHLVPPEACEYTVEKIGSGDKEDVCLDTGHIGIYVSSKMQGAFAPKIISWLRERDGAEEKKSPETPVKKGRKGARKTGQK